jgi:hypothetical protein
MKHNNVMLQRLSAQCLAAVGNLLYYVCNVIVMSRCNYLRMRLNSPPLVAHDGADAKVCYVFAHLGIKILDFWYYKDRE